MRRLTTVLISKFTTNSVNKQLFKERIDKLVQSIQEQLKPNYLRVKDISLKTMDDDQTIKVEVESDLFKGVHKVDQHRMVIACFGQDIQEIHAFLISTRVPIDKDASDGTKSPKEEQYKLPEEDNKSKQKVQKQAKGETPNQ